MQLSLITKLIDENENALVKGELVKLQINEDIDLFELYLRSTTCPKAYLKTREGKREYLGLGLSQEVQDIDQALTELPLFYNQSFDEDKTDEHWDEIGTSYHFFSAITLIKKCNKTELFLTLGDLTLEELKQLTNLREETISTSMPETKSILNTPEIDQWSESVDKSISAMEKDEFDKVVLARKHTQYFESNVDHSAYIKSYVSRKGNNFIYMLNFTPDKSFVSLSPESLLKIEKDKLNIDVIAGTRSMSDNETENLTLATELQNDPKEIHEHEIVLNEVEKHMQEYCDEYELVFNKNILKQKHVQHLYSLFEGALNTEVSLTELISDLHPTPAVGGTPKEKALEIIKEKEPFARGLYAAPCGVISRDYSELLVAIRSVLLEKDCVNIYAGAGIVKGSRSNYEWKETTRKMRNFLSPIC